MKKYFLTSILGLVISLSNAQTNSTYWQQHVDYTMEIDVDVENYQYDGKQK